ncbi:MAG: hypothetical protein JOZ02_05995 [Acidobacteria bacterium]|nr:hypothetical protein [Acidobacteriota bacterium]
MHRRALAIIVSGMLWSSMLGYQPAGAQAQGATRAASAVRAAVEKLGVGSKARVEVKLRDGTKLKGSVSSIGEDSFTITDSKTGASRTVAYAEVARVKEPNRGFWARASVLAVAAVAVTAMAALDDGGVGY